LYSFINAYVNVREVSQILSVMKLNKHWTVLYFHLKANQNIVLSTLLYKILVMIWLLKIKSQKVSEKIMYNPTLYIKTQIINDLIKDLKTYVYVDSI